MPIHPEVEKYLENSRRLQIPLKTLVKLVITKPVTVLKLLKSRDSLEDLTGITPEVVRYYYESVSRPGPEVHSVEDKEIQEGIPIRIYRPKESSEPLPVIVYFHGGGWVIGSLNTHDETCRSMANAIGVVVVSVDYRLAPEHPFPAAPQDCYAATCWVAENAQELGIDPSRLVVAGDSAGGNLAAVVAQIAREEKKPEIIFQALIYPAVDIDLDRWPSYEENANAPILTTTSMKWFLQHYVGTTLLTNDPLAAPIRAKDFSGLPPCYIATAEFDPLRDEGMAYANVLAEAGVTVEAKCFDGLVHGFSSLAPDLEIAEKARDEIFEAIKKAVTA